MSEEDEVYSVARLLGDLVAYRASGTGHLELLAGLALLQRHGQSSKSFEDLMEAPKDHIQEAVALHKFAVAAYTVMHKKFIISVFEFIILILFKLFHGAGSFT
jgi:hypothetical protein